MGFSSQAISVKSSINLSDINIDNDLDLGTNTLTANKLIVSSLSDITVGSATLDKLIPTLNIDGTICQDLGLISEEVLNDDTTYETGNSTVTILLTYTFTEDYTGYIRIKNDCIAGVYPTYYYLYHNSTELKNISIVANGGTLNIEYAYNITAVTGDTITFRAKVSTAGSGRYARINNAIIQKLDIL